MLLNFITGAFFYQRCALLANTSLIGIQDVKIAKKIITMTSKVRQSVSLAPMERIRLPERSSSTNAKAQKV